jgi:hypothetical protein
LGNFGSGSYLSASVTVVIFGNIQITCRQKSGKAQIFSFQISYRSIDKFIKIMRKNFVESPTPIPSTPVQEAKEIYGKINRFVISSVIRFCPFRCFRIKNHFQGKGVNLASIYLAAAAESPV